MMILIANLFIDLAVFAHCQGSPKRLPTQEHSAEGQPSTSGRSDGDVKLGDLIMEDGHKLAAEAFATVCHHNEKGIFYEENGRLHAVRTGTPLLEYKGHIVGRPRDGHVVLVYDFEGNPVVVAENNHKRQSFMSIKDVQKSHVPIPSHYNIVNARVPHEPQVQYSDAVIQPGKQKVKKVDMEILGIYQ